MGGENVLPRQPSETRSKGFGRIFFKPNPQLTAAATEKGPPPPPPKGLQRLVEALLAVGLIDEAKRNAAVLGHNFPGDVWYSDAYKLMEGKGVRPALTPEARSKGFGGIFFNRKPQLTAAATEKGPPPPKTGPPTKETLALASGPHPQQQTPCWRLCAMTHSSHRLF